MGKGGRGGCPSLYLVRDHRGLVDPIRAFHFQATSGHRGRRHLQ